MTHIPNLWKHRDRYSECTFLVYMFFALHSERSMRIADIRNNFLEWGRNDLNGKCINNSIEYLARSGVLKRTSRGKYKFVKEPQQ